VLENEISNKFGGKLENHGAFVLFGGEGKYVGDQEVEREGGRGGEVAADSMIA
jgi:hypothetical protein